MEVWNHNKHKRTFLLSAKNVMLPHIALSLAIFTGITLKFGLLASVFSITQAVMCTLMIEIINYVEHYGLKREKDENGIYAPVTIRHSWNAP
jgi:alkane 1-monooxygenase